MSVGSMALYAAEGDTLETRHFATEPAYTFTREDWEAGTHLLEVDTRGSFANPEWLEATLTFLAPPEGHE